MLKTILLAALPLLFAAPKTTAVRKSVPRKAPVQAAVNPHRKSPYVGALSADAATGRIIFERGADTEAYLASVTKLMTAFIVMDDVRAKKMSLDDAVVASPVQSRADRHLRQPSCVGLKAGESMSVEMLLKSLLVHSANDAAVFLAEKCSGSVSAFVARMNAKAASLGMSATRFYNPNGLPPPPGATERKFNVSTCRDLLKLARALLSEHPDILHYTSIKVLAVTLPDGKDVKFVNHNNVMVKNKLKVMNPDGKEAVDGLKTGYIDAGGSSVLLTGSRGGKRAIVVVLGSSTSKERDENARKLMSDALDAMVW